MEEEKNTNPSGEPKKGKSKGEKSFDSKKMLADHGEKGTKIKYNERLKVEITADNMQFYKKGDVINPHKVKGQALIDQGVAKKYVEDED